MSFVRDHIGNLLGNTVVAPSDGHEQELAAVLALREQAGPQAAVNLVSYAHGGDVAAAQSAVAEIASRRIDSWQDEHEALGRRIAAAAVISLYEEETNDSAVAACLACMSASFISLSPVVADLHSRVTAAMGCSSRKWDAESVLKMITPGKGQCSGTLGCRRKMDNLYWRKATVNGSTTRVRSIRSNVTLPTY